MSDFALSLKIGINSQMPLPPVEILTNRFILKSLDVTNVSDRYASWLSDHVTSKYIANRPNLVDLRQYVIERSDRDDVLFLGIFEKIEYLHIGNIKYEPVDTNLGYAIVGILVGESDWRGQGVAIEVLVASAKWLHQYRNIKQIILGVSRANVAAVRAYQKAGFIEEESVYISSVSAENITMVLHLKEQQ